MKHELKQFLDPHYHYVYDHGPQKIRSKSQARIEGLNCQTLTHFVLAELGANLPENMLSKEIYEDNEYLTPINRGAELQQGDIFLFGQNEEQDLRKLHLAVFTGDNDDKGNPLLIHANWLDNGVTIWSLDQFANHSGYQKLYAIKRSYQLLSKQ